jgi:hypothetical protein
VNTPRTTGIPVTDAVTTSVTGLVTSMTNRMTGGMTGGLTGMVTTGCHLMGGRPARRPGARPPGQPRWRGGVRTPNTRNKRARRKRIAHRDGTRCAYCHHPIALYKATLDHVVPIYLFPTWHDDHLVIACRACNRAKSNRFPLLIALLTLAHYGPPADRTPDPDHRSDVRDAPRHTPIGLAETRLLARLAHTRQTADPAEQQSPPEQPGSPDHTPDPTGARTATGLPDCMPRVVTVAVGSRPAVTGTAYPIGVAV